MKTKLMLFLAALATSAMVVPGQAQTTSSTTQPSSGGLASHSELLNNNTPEEKAETQRQDIALKQSDALNHSGEQLLGAEQFAAAEADFREALALRPDIPSPYVGLAEALYAQGRVAEALHTYQTLFTYPNNTSSTAQETRVLMGYAIALSQVGRWAEAVSIYEKTIPISPDYGDAPKIDIHFDRRVPMPAHLQALAYVASGLEYFGHGENRRAYLEYAKALRADPASAFANYYYGFGWNSLDATDKARLGGEQEAKAALQKAVLMGKGDVKKAAQKALKDLNKPAAKPA